MGIETVTTITVKECGKGGMEVWMGRAGGGCCELQLIKKMVAKQLRYSVTYINTG